MGKIEVRSSRARAGSRVAAAGLLLALLAACSLDGLVGDAPLPSDLNDPAATHTPAGALSAYRGALARFARAFGVSVPSAVAASGVLGDELQDAAVVGAPAGASRIMGLDARVLPEQTDPEIGGGWTGPYGNFQAVRGQAQEGLGLLRDFPPQPSPALQGHLYAITGYSEVLLADLYCSGIPLSTLDYNGDFTLRPGASTAEVYQHAAALFDTALTLSSDSTRFLNLARVGKARALLGLGDFAQAAAAVQDVPDGYRYEVSYTAAVIANNTRFNFAGTQANGGTWVLSVSDREGGSGLDYRGSGDPRTASSPGGTSSLGVTVYHPDTYASDGSSPIVLADWVEARLIEAEAALQAGDVSTWLAKLNHLRETAITPALPDTTDPGTADARVDLLFRERAFWLFLTGHRQGDLRRLIRQYGRRQDQVYPSGTYPAGAAFYGTDVNLPIPAAERASNPLFSGCQSRGA
jgi:hypothetical protein